MRFYKVIAKIEGCNVSPHSVLLPASVTTGELVVFYSL